MFTRVWFILKYWLCWIILFEACRLLFLAANFAQMSSAGVMEAGLSLWYGLRMDFSAAAYITLPVSLLVLMSVFVPVLRNITTYRIYTAVILLLIVFIVFADIGLFRAWGFRIDATAFKYLANPKEVWASISHLPILAISLLLLVLYAFLVFTSGKLLRRWAQLLQPSAKKLLSFLSVLLLTAAFILPIRGGIQLAPLNQSSVYFSQNNFANQAALNASWNLLRSLSRRANNVSNPFVVGDSGLVNRVVDSLLYTSSVAQPLLNRTDTSRPNVIVIVWESFTSKAVDLSVAGKPITPGFNQLKNEGLYFSNIYATGDRTDKGIVGILGGYPAQPTTSIIKDPEKAAKIPMISKLIKNAGYQTSFHYGGELEFANMKAYLLQGGFNQFVTVNDFKDKDKNSKWGAHDGVVMQRLEGDLQKMQQPFFSVWLTLSSHEPYEIPSTPILPQSDDTDKFLSSLHYTDFVVYSFVTYARKQPWWHNTLLVIVADHGHRLPSAVNKQEDFKIPLLFLGGALKSPGQVIDKIGSQTDVAATLLHQLAIPAKSFKWSRNLLDSSRMPWAMFTFNNGFGWLQPGKQLVFDNVGKRPITSIGSVNERDVFIGKALQQAAFQDYLNK